MYANKKKESPHVVVEEEDYRDYNETNNTSLSALCLMSSSAKVVELDNFSIIINTSCQLLFSRKRS